MNNMMFLFAMTFEINSQKLFEIHQFSDLQLFITLKEVYQNFRIL